MVTDQKKNLIYSLSVIFAVGFISISFISYYIGLSELRNKITQNELPLTIDNIYYNIRDELQKPIHISSFMANDYFLKKWVIDGEKNPSEVVSYLKDVKDNNDALTSFFISAKTLNYYHPTAEIVKVHEDDPIDSWFFDIRDDVSKYQVNFDYDYINSDLLTIFVNYKVVDYQGDFLGVAGIGIDLDVAKKFIDNVSDDLNHDIYFLEKNGDVYLKSKGAKSQFENINDFPPLSNQANAILSSDRGTFEYESEEGVHYLTTRYIKEFNWVVMVEKNDQEHRITILNSLITNIIISIFVFIIIAFVTHIFLRNYQKELEAVALKDHLTGLYNRHALDIVFEELFNRLNREPRPTCMLMLDIDYFKKFNDEFGHLLGDEVLKHVANTIKGELRASDVVCRWGGEEFLVILENVNLALAKIMADKIRVAIESHPLLINGTNHTVTVSVGVGQYEDKDTDDSFISRVDKALYHSKHNGRNQVSSSLDLKKL